GSPCSCPFHPACPPPRPSKYRVVVSMNTTETSEEIAPPLKQLLLQHVLDTAWRQSATRLLALRQLLTKPAHGGIEMMEFEFIDTIDAIILAPMFTRPVGARHHQAMQHGQEHRAFDRELETPPRKQILHNGTAPALLP